MSLIASPNEPLQKHLEDVTEEILTRFLPKRAKLLVKLLKPYGDVDSKSVEHAILYAGIFHDVGKAYEPFQKMLKETGKAPHHEIFSVFFSDMVLTKMRKDLKTIVLLAMAWHHSATRGTVLERIGGTTSKYLQDDSVKLNEYSKNMLFRILDSTFLKFKCGEEVSLSNIPEIITVNDARNLLDEMGKSLRKEKSNSYTIYFAALPLLTALQIADSKIAFENRKGETLPVHLRDITNLDAKRRIVQNLMRL
ncbi:MAG: CRISPR-associated endonuclease Cas3'' [Candidatus Brockarchaeota archaeon]|nr:CRISPR-associated endonuclease Cas3'' [Candidatus Brockarchaeota archaeon]MBO3808971.1 CRISPR-associated endonuclease Cas3'' [Candidatus Brockarchaeota archaeon]MBO3842415.1 CRISPR-associated endonuclease Cas3'' [Candidatus Brockarchaeota archaeon]